MDRRKAALSIGPRSKGPRPAVEAAPWSDVVLVCVKCAAKLGRAHNGKTELRSEIRRALKDRGIKTIRVLDTTCLDLCPKGGQTIALGREIGAGLLRVFDEDADGDDVARWLAEPKRR